MSLAELIKQYGQAARFRHNTLANSVPLVVVAEDGGYYFVKFDTDKYATVTPKEAESGWSIVLKEIPVRVCVWRYLNPNVDTPVERYEFREGVNPWECRGMKDSPMWENDMDEMKNWHRCDDEDVVLKETR